MTRTCPVCIGRVDHAPADVHTPAVIAAASRRNATIGEAGRRFGEVRDVLAKKLSGASFMTAIREHERAYDEVVTAAQATYAEAIRC